MTKKVLITGFEPFGGKKTNITEQALRGAAEVSDVHTEILPVAFGRAAMMTADMMRENDYDSILLLGERPSVGSVIGFVARAHNRAYAGLIADNDDQRKLGRKIIGGAPAKLEATMSYEELREALEGAPLRSRVQHKIGRFVCNDVFYRLLHKQISGEINPHTQIGFAHIGSQSEVGAVGVAIHRLAQTLRDATL